MSRLAAQLPCLILAGGTILFALGTQFAPGSPPDARVDTDFFESRIRPVLAERCYKCHSARSEKLKGGLRLDTREGILRGGSRGPAIVPGQPHRSLLVAAIRREHQELAMPPDGKLTDEQIADFAAWIEAGATDPRRGEKGATGSRPAAASAAASGHWAFKAPADPVPPAVRRSAWPRSPVDGFILAKLEEKGLDPSPEADRRTLIRRLTYDLAGLPPRADEVAAFASEDSPDALERLAERLLASPRYGERWGRAWLDVARYADTKGYVYTDREDRRFFHAHVYRDWVVRAFNRDMPYDRFLLLQIAADELVKGKAEGIDRRDLAAMGFLTLGRRFLGVIHDIIDDRLDVVMRGTQALTVGCARCHDHKFDPIPTRDYYSLYGVFQASSEQAIALEEDPAPTPEYLAYAEELGKRDEALRNTFEKKRAELTERLREKAGDYLAATLDVEQLHTEEFYSFLGPDDLNPVVVRQWHTYLLAAGGFHPVFAPWQALERLPAKDFAARARAAIADLTAAPAVAAGGGGRGLNPLVAGAFAGDPPASMRETADRYAQLFARVRARWRDAAGAAAKAGLPGARALDDPAEEEVRQVLYGPESPAAVPAGSIWEVEWFFEESTRVELGKLQSKIDALKVESPGAPPHALVLTDRPGARNPRVFIRGNPAQRGEEAPRQFLEVLSGPGRKPFEHGSGRRELALAIASRDNPLTARVLVNRAWLHHFGAGLVKTPSDFGTRCEPPSHPELLDWLARTLMDDDWSLKRIHRLIVLSSTYRQASDADPGRLRIDPENRLLARMRRTRLDFEALRDSLLAAAGELDLRMGGRPDDVFALSAPARRTIYGLVDRQFLPGAFRIFDFANPDQHSAERHATTVPQQALFLLNSPFVVDRARALSRRAHDASGPGAEERVRTLHQIAYQRQPEPREVEAALRFVSAAREQVATLLPPAAAAWLHGHGEYDEAAKCVKGFERLPHFTGAAWQGGPAWPDPGLGWVQLTAKGGHAGNDLSHAAIRRWTAPRDGKVSVRGEVAHSHKEGDGIRSRIVSSRTGSLAAWSLHDQKAEAAIEPIEVRAGDTIDFVVDMGATLGWDDFAWAPVIRMGAEEWKAEQDFAGPPPEPLDAWEEYAQALLVGNEFVFVD